MKAPFGTCYAADDQESAVRERLRDVVLDGQTVSYAQASAIVVSRIIRRPGRYAAVSDTAAVRHGVIRELCTMTGEYAVPQAWAERFRRSGFDGIHYASRFTSVPAANAWAIFGQEGEDPKGEVNDRFKVDGPTACQEAGIFVLPPPPTDTSQLTIFD